jgi:PAS domain S-box-containing protein
MTDRSALYDHAPCALVVTRADGTIVAANAAFVAWTGHAATDVVDRVRLQDLLTVGSRIFHQTHWGPLLQMQGSVAEVKVDLVHRDGHAVPLLLNAMRRTHDGAVVHDIALFVVQDRNRYERELLKARSSLADANALLSKADRQKDVFLATLAHELRNPLAPLRNGLELLRRLPHDATVRDKARQMMERQVAHLVHLVDDLLDVARFNSGKIDLRSGRVDLLDVVADAVDATMPMIEATRHELVLSLPPTPTWVTGDATRLVQIVANLLNNAAKYTSPGGRLDVRLVEDGATAVLSVIDSGVGLTADALTRVFDMFAQEEASRGHAQGGLGIGLSLVKRLVALHGGTVTARSAGPGQGSTFEVRLPLAGPVDAVSATPNA